MTFQDSPSLDLGIIGVGRVGSTLGAALARAGHQVVAVNAVSDAARARAADHFPAAAVLDPVEVAQRSQLLLISVPDDQLAGLVKGIAAADGFHSGQFVVHTSGAKGLLPLLPAIDAGAIGLALHPAMTFSGGAADLERLPECPFAVTAPAGYRPVAEALVYQLGGEPFWIDDADRVRYHAALSHAANHLTVLIEQAAELLDDIGIENSHRVLAPLTNAALENVLLQGPSALTGPISRGDVETVRAHMADLPQSLQSSYRVLAAGALALARRNRTISSEQAEAIEQVLQS